MSKYNEYIKQIIYREVQNLHPLPIDGAEVTKEIIEQIKDATHEHRTDSLKFFIYNVLPGTTSAADVKAEFLKEIILGKHNIITSYYEQNQADALDYNKKAIDLIFTKVPEWPQKKVRSFLGGFGFHNDSVFK